MATSFCTFYDPQPGQTLRCDVGAGTQVGTIDPAAANSAILGGTMANTNLNCGNVSVILFGDTNHINTFAGTPTTYAFIGNGINNCVGDPLFGDASYSTIINGHNNAALGGNSFIGSGDSNRNTSGLGFIGNGTNNALLDYAAIVGGNVNQAGGCNSFIGAGSNNTALAHSFAGVFGCNIASVCPNMFHVNCLNVKNMQDMSTYPSVALIPLPIGTLYYCCIGSGPASRCQVYIR